MTALVHEAWETYQGRCAYNKGVSRGDNPYKWTPNSRQGDRKRACWELGWDTEHAAASEAECRGL